MDLLGIHLTWTTILIVTFIYHHTKPMDLIDNNSDVCNSNNIVMLHLYCLLLTVLFYYSELTTDLN
jgi:hypothetical protein